MFDNPSVLSLGLSERYSGSRPDKFSAGSFQCSIDSVLDYFECAPAIVVGNERRHFDSVWMRKAGIKLSEYDCLTIHVFGIATLFDKRA